MGCLSGEYKRGHMMGLSALISLYVCLAEVFDRQKSTAKPSYCMTEENLPGKYGLMSLYLSSLEAQSFDIEAKGSWRLK